MFFIIKDGRLHSDNSSSSQFWGDKIGGELDAWDTISSDPNRFIRDSYGTLSERNSTLYQTAPLARAAINKPLSYVIGDGIVFKSAINSEFLGWTREKAKEWSRKFTTLLHLEKMAADWYDNQAVLFREASICGDSILYFLRDEESLLPIELIPAGGHAIDWQKTTDPDMAKDWVLGIKLDKFGRRKAFWQKSSASQFDFKDKDGNINAIQFWFNELAGQARGYGMIHSVIALLKKMDKVWDATVARMVLESIMMGYYNVDTTDPGAQIRNYAAAAKGHTTQTTRDNTATANVKSDDITPGTMMTFGNKESMQFTDLKTPSDNFGLANEWFLKMLGMARGYPPEFLVGEYSTSYTAHKGALNDAWKRSMYERTLFTRKVEKPVNLEYLKYFVRTKQIDVPSEFWTDHKVREALLMGSYLGPVPGHINPLQEVKADEAAVKNSFTDHESVARKYGHDWNDYVDEWADQQDRWLAGSAEQKAEQMAAEETRRTAEAQAVVSDESESDEDTGNTEGNDEDN